MPSSCTPTWSSGFTASCVECPGLIHIIYEDARVTNPLVHREGQEAHPQMARPFRQTARTPHQTIALRDAPLCALGD
eukprot:6473802-Amphidinium_carterae.1